MGIWLRSVRPDQTQQMIEEVIKGDSTLLMTAKLGVVRCVPLVAIRLVRDDGQLLVSLRLSKTARGKYEASCMLPGLKQHAGEHPEQCFHRFLEGQFAPLAGGLEPMCAHRETESGNSKSFGVPTRYIRTVIEAKWLDSHDRELENYVAQRGRREPSKESSDHDDRCTSDQSKGTQYYQRPASTVGTPHSRLHTPSQYRITKVYEVQERDKLYQFAWVSPVEFEYFSSSRGHGRLVRLLQPWQPFQMDGCHQKCDSMKARASRSSSEQSSAGDAPECENPPEA